MTTGTDFKQLVIEAIEQFPDRVLLLGEIGLETRNSRVPVWLGSMGLSYLGLAVCWYGDELLFRTRMRQKRWPAWWTTIGSMILGASAGAGIVQWISTRTPKAAPVTASRDVGRSASIDPSG